MRKFFLLWVVFVMGCSPVSPGTENNPVEYGQEANQEIIGSPDEVASQETTQEAPVVEKSEENTHTEYTTEPATETQTEPAADVSTEHVTESVPEAGQDASSETTQEASLDAGTESVTESAPETTQDLAALTCQERLDRSLQEIESVLKQNLTCSENTDCTSVGVSTGCRGACLVAVNQTGKTKVEGVVTQINQSYCKTYQADGCPYATPKCVSNKPFCHTSQCVLMDCSTRMSTARQLLDDVRKQHLSCQSDSDCVLFFNSTNCAGGCQSAVNKTGEAVILSTIANINKTICNNYQADGCPYATPSCIPSQPKCDNNQCIVAR